MIIQSWRVKNRCQQFLFILILCHVFALHTGAEQTIRLPSSSSSEIVLFPFDNASIPWRHGLQLSLVQAIREDKLILTTGNPGSPDSGRISYYGTVLRVGNELKMWYLGHPAEDLNHISICYATSKDGWNWEKPILGLVEYNGTKNNNLVALDVPGDAMSCNVVYEPDDPDPERRFKMFYEVRPEYRGNVAFSRDGLNWKPSSKNPVTHTRIEPTGLIRHEGCYYVCGQNANIDRGFQKRVLITLASYNFEDWTESANLGFRRDPVPPRLLSLPYNSGAQVHLGAGLWDRGNVILGFYGMWNMPLGEMDRRLLRMDVGLLVSHDALQYHEPIPDFKIIDGFEEQWKAGNPEGDPAALSQGQGVENIGEKTITWYGVWGPANQGIRLAWWELDRLGFYYPAREPIEGQRWVSEVPPHFISCPIESKEPFRVYVNADGLNVNSQIQVEVLNQQFEPLDGYTTEEAIPITQPGFRQAAIWKQNESFNPEGEKVRLCIHFGGIRPEDARVYAVYVAPDSANQSR